MNINIDFNIFKDIINEKIEKFVNSKFGSTTKNVFESTKDFYRSPADFVDSQKFGERFADGINNLFFKIKVKAKKQDENGEASVHAEVVENETTTKGWKGFIAKSVNFILKLIIWTIMTLFMGLVVYCMILALPYIIVYLAFYVGYMLLFMLIMKIIYSAA